MKRHTPIIGTFAPTRNLAAKILRQKEKSFGAGKFALLSFKKGYLVFTKKQLGL